jgi:putative transposase
VGERIRDLEEQVKILRKAAAAVEAVVPPKDRYRLVAELHAEGVRTGRPCHALGVSRSGYYAWAGRAPSPRAIRQAWLTDLIGTVHQASRGTYGAPRVHAELVYGHGITVGHNTVSLLMRRAGLAGLPAHSRGKRTKKLATVTDLVRRDFRRTGPDQLWVTDITEHPTREGKVYCCVVLDLHRTGPRAGLLPSLGTVGDPYDNAVAESFWARMQTKLLNRQRWDTASNWPTRSSSTSRTSTTGAGAIPRSAGRHQ